MKLVELLVKELKEWPEEVTYFVQDGDSEVKAGSGSDLTKPETSSIWVRHITLDSYNFYSDLCTDWRTSIVTKDIYTEHKEEPQMKQKVRNDFDLTKEYSVNVSGCTVEEKEKVQRAFFDAGIFWGLSGKIFKHLDAAQYTNTLPDGEVSADLMYGGTSEDCNMTPKEFMDLVYEPEQQEHVHDEPIAQYAEDDKTTDNPGELWQYGCTVGNKEVWFDLDCYLPMDCGLKFRRKPKTHFIHGVEIPDLRITPEYGDVYWCPVPHSKGKVASFKSWDISHDVHRIENGLCYEDTVEGMQAAILHSKAMLGTA